MHQNASIQIYPFKGASEENGYRLFPDELENDDQVFFHGTADANRASIIEKGFRIAGSLPSISFARNSSLALKYASEARSTISPEGCILAVRFGSLDDPSIRSESFGLHVDNFDKQPEIIGYCIIPADYVFR